MKPGIKTTELWITVISQLVAAIVVLLSTVYGVELDIDVFTKVVATGGAFVYATLTAYYYIRSRASVKMQQAVKESAERIKLSQ